MTITEAVVVSLLSGFASSVISIIFSFKQFSSKKWWEKKSDEYLRIVKELVSLQNCVYKWEDYYWDIISNSNNKKLSDSEMSELVKENKILNESIRITAMTGSILVSEETTKELENLLKQMNGLEEIGQDDPLEAVRKEYELIKKAVKNIRIFAKRDLSINK